MVPGPAKVRTLCLCVGRKMGLRMGYGGGQIGEDGERVEFHRGEGGAGVQ